MRQTIDCRKQLDRDAGYSTWGRRNYVGLHHDGPSSRTAVALPKRSARGGRCRQSVATLPSVAAGGSQSHALARPSAVIWDAATDGKTAGSKTIGVEGKKRDKLTRSERADVTQWALQQGVPAEEMISAYEGIPQFTAMAAQIEAAKPNSFAASGIEWVGTDAKPWIVFTDRPDSQVLTQLQSLSTEVEVEWGAPASKQELETISAELLT